MGGLGGAQAPSGRRSAPGTQPRTGRTICRGAKLSTSVVQRTRNGEPFDVVLSSGFLAFANHSGFLQAVEEAGIHVTGVMGTSAGALAGSLYCAGYSPREVAQHLSESPPIQLLKPCWEPWRGGVLSLDAVIERLAQLLPPTFEDLQKDFAVGVVTGDGRHVLIDSGPLPAAVAASAAIPFVFSSVDVPGRFAGLKDGGVVDRIGLKPWRDRRRRQPPAHAVAQPAAAAAALPPCLVHIIERSSPFSGADDPSAAGERDVHVVRSPRSGVSFWDLGSFDAQFDAARRRARPVLERALVKRTGADGSGSAAKVAGVRAAPTAPQAGMGLGGGSGGSGGGGYSAGLRPQGLGPVRPAVVARRGGGVGGSSGSGCIAVRATSDDSSGPVAEGAEVDGDGVKAARG